MRDRYFGSRVKRLFNERGWSMASFSRRTTVGRSILKRIMETRGYVYGITQHQINCIAAAFNVTVEYLERGTQDSLIRPDERQSQWEIARLRQENDRLRRRRTATETLDAMRAGSREASKARELMTWATDQRLEIVVRNEKFVVLREHEFEIAEGDTINAALAVAFQGEDDA